ncbi:ABC transporter substrate-binding protein [Diplocloster agilis]|uniref:ABC transporter substrate-binding protein n=1 Tax=Diplocloster agilis TaxID=2850323 RepID=UPI001EE85D27|nr:extracellular solute-binding protein [Diplocloster agilis]
MTALAMSAVMVIGLLAGCGNSPAASQTPGEAGKEDSGNSTAAEESKDAKGEVIELTFPNIWVGNDSKAKVFGEMIDGFNTEYAGKYTIKIEEQTDYDAYRDKIRTQISTGNTPDIFTFDDRGSLELYSASGKLMDLTDFLNEEDMKARFQDGQVESTQVDGVNYAFPYESAVIPIMFNNKLLKEAGVEQVPTTFEDFWDACEKLKAKDIIPVCQMTNNNAIFSVYWYSYLLAAIGGEDVFKNGLDDPAFEKAAEYMKNMFEYSSSDAVGADATVANGHFFNERAAIYANGTWILGRIKSEGVEGLYDNIVISPGLSIDGKNGGAYLTTTQAYFAAGRQDDPAREEAIKTFFRYITDPDKVVELADSSGALFAIKIDASKLSDKLQGEVVKQSSEAPFHVGHFNFEMPTPVVNAFPAALEGLILGDLTPAEFVDQLKAAQE